MPKINGFSTTISFHKILFLSLLLCTTVSATQTIKIGILFPETWTDSGYPLILKIVMGQTVDIMRYLVSQYNQTLSPQYNLEYVIYDTHTFSNLATVGAVQLYQEGVSAVIGCFNSDATIAAQNFLGNYRVPQLSYTAGSSTLDDKTLYPSFLRIIEDANAQSKIMVDIVQKYGWTHIITVNSEDSYGLSGISKFFDALNQYNNITVVQQLSLTPTSNFTAAIDTIIDAQCYIIVVFASGTVVTPLMNEAAKYGLNNYPYFFLGSDTFYGAAVTNKSIDWTGLVTFQPYQGNSTVLQESTSLIQSLDPIEYPYCGPSHPLFGYTNFAYDSMMTVINALMIQIDNNMNMTDHQTLLNTIQNTTYHGKTGIIQFDSNGNRLPNYELVNYYNNTWHLYSTWISESATSHVFTEIQPLIFAGGKTEIPPDGPSYPKSYISYSSGLAIAFMVISVLIILVIVIGASVIYYYRDTARIRAASPLFLILMCVGLCLQSASVFGWIGYPTIAICNIRLWFSAVGFYFTMAALLAKTWRLWRLLTEKSLKIISIDNKVLLTIFLIGLGFESILLIIWSSVYPLNTFASLDLTAKHYNMYCNSIDVNTGNNVTTIFLAVQLILYGLMVIYASILAFQVRNLPRLYNEAKYIAWACGMMAFFSILAIALAFILSGIILGMTVSIVICIYGLTLVVFGFIIVPKLYIIFVAPELLDQATKTNTTQGALTTTKYSNKSSGLHSSNSTPKV